MTVTDSELERLFQTIRGLPKQRQQTAVEALTEIATEPYQLSQDEAAVLLPALERSQRNEFASDADIADLLDKPWQ